MHFKKSHSSVFKGQLHAAPQIQMQLKTSQESSGCFKTSARWTPISGFTKKEKRTWKPCQLLECVEYIQTWVSSMLSHRNSHLYIQILDTEKNILLKIALPLNMLFFPCFETAYRFFNIKPNTGRAKHSSSGTPEVGMSSEHGRFRIVSSGEGKEGGCPLEK